MKVHEEVISGLNIEPFKNSANNSIDVPNGFFKIPFLMASYAVKNSGKTTAVANLLSRYRKIGRCHRIFLLAPTAHANKNIWGTLIADDDIFTSPSQGSLDNVLDLIREEAEDYNRYKSNTKAYQEFKAMEREMISGKRCFMPEDVLLHAHEHDFFKGPPKYKYASHPCIFLVIDDCFASPLFSQSSQANSLANLATKHRHLFGIGCSIVITMQAYKASAGVISRALRPNFDIICLYRFKDQSVVTGFFEELAASDMTLQQFIQLYEYCTREPFNFMTLYNGQVRKNWDAILSIDTYEESDSH